MDRTAAGQRLIVLARVGSGPSAWTHVAQFLRRPAGARRWVQSWWNAYANRDLLTVARFTKSSTFGRGG
jgi:hypothetical protein